MINTIFLVIDIVSAFAMILLVLLHSGRGSGFSDMFGGGSSLSGGTGVEKLLDRFTVVAAGVFAFSTFWLAWKWR
jgi:preprotein translocase subunit SecG